MTQVLLLVVYMGISVLIGFIGRNRKFGFWGFFFCSLLLTPVVGLLTYFASCEKVKIILKDKENS